MANTSLPLMANDGVWFMLFLVAVAVLYLMVRLLHLANPSVPPVLLYRDSPFNQKIGSLCDVPMQWDKRCHSRRRLLHCRNHPSISYVPPLLWGKSGHLQTMVYGKLGRVKSPFPKGQRCSVVMPDGATMTYDVFEPLQQHTLGDFTIVVCPGIANSSESLYVCTFVHYAQTNGYRVAVLNHLGALKDVRLTAPRIYTYGGTEEYGAMVDQILQSDPESKLVAVGFSMGGNVVIKYVGEKQENEQKFVAAISCCQGYDAEAAQLDIMKWDRCQRVFNWAMTQHQKKLMKHHYDELFGSECEEKYGSFDEEKIFSATSLITLDEYYSRRRAGFSTLQDYYCWASCKHCIQNITIPVFLLNALDDPIIAEPLLMTAKNFALSRENVIFVLTEHGGHLGFFEGGMTVPDTITWLDKVVVQYTNAVVMATGPQAVQC